VRPVFAFAAAGPGNASSPNHCQQEVKRIQAFAAIGAGHAARISKAQGSTCSQANDPVPPPTTPPTRRPFASNYVGFSIEVPSAADMIGKAPQPIRTPFATLVKQLHHSDKQDPTLIRVGGNSADESVWNPDGQRLPPQYHVEYNITQLDLASYRRFGDALGGTAAFVLDLSFIRGDDPSWPAAQVAAIGAGIGWDHIHAVSIGNEIDLFARIGLRPENYTYDESKAEWELYAKALYAAGLPASSIRGATWCCFGETFDAAAFGDLAASFRDQLLDMSYHRYPLSHCDGHSTTLADLLQAHASTGQAAMMQPFADAAHAAGLPFVIGESNSVACGGQDEVSNVLGASLWAVDYLLAMSTTGARTVNFHGGPRGYYAAIQFSSSAPGTPPTVQPLFYAMRVIAEVTANSSQMLALETVESSNPQVRVWALAQGDAQVFVVVHKDPGAAGAAAVSASRSDSGGQAQGRLAVLSAPGGVTAKDGLSWAGQTWDGSQDGMPLGQRSTSAVPGDAGTYTFQVDPGTVAVLWT